MFYPSFWKIGSVFVTGGKGLISLDGETILTAEIEPKYGRVRASIRGHKARSTEPVTVLRGFVAEGENVEARERVLGEQSILVGGIPVLDVARDEDGVRVLALNLRPLGRAIELRGPALLVGLTTLAYKRFTLLPNDHMLRLRRSVHERANQTELGEPLFVRSTQKRGK